MTNPNTTVNAGAYVARMASVDDKARLADLLPGDGPVLDYGCGAGALVPFLDAAGVDVADRYTGYDAYPDMVAAARRAHPGVGFADDLADLRSEAYASIVLCSVLHEVVAYLGTTDPVRTASGFLSRVVHDFLASGGSVLVRDGLAARPDRGDIVSYRLRDDVDARYFMKAAATHGRDYSHLYAHGWLTGPHREVADFLNLYTWGWESLAREAHEVVNVFDADQWRDVVARSGLVAGHVETYSQPDYFRHLDEVVDLDGDVWDTKVLMSLSRR